MTNIMLFLGGVALFLYGISMMSDYLKKVGGNKFKQIIEKVVDNPLSAILVGALITAITGSSSAMVVLIIGLVRAGIINSKQTVGLILGSNIGSTITAFIISLPISDYAYLILFFGVVLMFMGKTKIKNIGGVMIGISLLFVGLNTMNSGVQPIIENGFEASRFFNESFLGITSGFLFGTAFTTIVQSSGATVAIVQKLYAMNTEIATISLKAAIPILIGANIGTTITGVLASLGGNSESRKASYTHIIFNVFIAILFLPLIGPFSNLMTLFETKVLSQYSMATLAFAHLFMNLVGVIIAYFLINQIVLLTEKLVPDKGEKQRIVFDEKIIEQSPSVALDLSRRGIKYLANLVYEYFILTKEYSFEYSRATSDASNEYEEEIDELNGNIHNYLIKIIRKGLSKEDTKDLSTLLDVTKDLERIGDHLTNIIEFFNVRYNERHDLSEEGKIDLLALYDILNEMLIEVLKSIDTDFKYTARNINELEAQVDILEKTAKTNFSERLKAGDFEFYQTSNFTDIVSDLERIGDHVYNIYNSIIDPMSEKIEITGLKVKGVNRDV